MKAKYKSCRYNGRRMRAHRAWLIAVIGEDSAKAYVVHHIDGNKFNNDASNLVILTASEHNKIHAKTQKRNAKGRFV